MTASASHPESVDGPANRRVLPVRGGASDGLLPQGGEPLPLAGPGVSFSSGEGSSGNSVRAPDQPGAGPTLRDLVIQTRDKATRRLIPLSAVTLAQPFADGLLHGNSVINRHHAPSGLGHLMLVCAGTRWRGDAAELLAELGIECPQAPSGYRFEQAVAVVRLVGAINGETGEVTAAAGWQVDPSVIDSPWWSGPVGWVVADVIELPPALDVEVLDTGAVWTVPLDGATRVLTAALRTLDLLEQAEPPDLDLDPVDAVDAEESARRRAEEGRLRVKKAAPPAQPATTEDVPAGAPELGAGTAGEGQGPTFLSPPMGIRPHMMGCLRPAGRVRLLALQPMRATRDRRDGRPTTVDDLGVPHGWQRPPDGAELDAWTEGRSVLVMDWDGRLLELLPDEFEWIERRPGAPAPKEHR